MPHMVHGLWVTLPVTRIAAERVIGGNLDQHDRDAVRILDPHLDQPHGSVAGPRRTRTPAAASRSCSACTSRPWSQIITESHREPPDTPDRFRAMLLLCHGHWFRQRLASHSAAFVSASIGTADDRRRRGYRGMTL